MAKQFKGTMGVAFPIESINRKLALRRETSGTKTVAGKILGGHKFMGGFTRTRSVVTGSGKTESIMVQYAFVRKFGRKSALTSKDITNRQNFAAVAKSVQTILEDLTQITRVQQLYLQARADVSKKMNGVSALGTASFRGWIFAVQYAGLKNDDEYNTDQFPNAFDA